LHKKKPAKKADQNGGELALGLDLFGRVPDEPQP